MSISQNSFNFQFLIIKLPIWMASLTRVLAVKLFNLLTRMILRNWMRSFQGVCLLAMNFLTGSMKKKASLLRSLSSESTSREFPALGTSKNLSDTDWLPSDRCLEKTGLVEQHRRNLNNRHHYQIYLNYGAPFLWISTVSYHQRTP